MLIHGILQIIDYNEETRRKKRKKEEKKDEEITVNNFNNGKCSYAYVTRDTTEPKPVIDLSVIYSQSIEQEKSNLSNIENTPSTLCTTSANVQNHSSSSVEINRSMEISSEELDQQNTTYENRLSGYFCSDTVFN